MEKENKYSRWMVTIGEVHATNLMEADLVKKLLGHVSVKWEFQLEKATSTHWQGCFETKIRKRKSTVLNEMRQFFDKLDGEDQPEVAADCLMPQVTIQPMRGSWDQAVAYCTKDDETYQGVRYSSELKYDGSDVGMLDHSTTRYPWQKTLINELLDANEIGIKDPDDRTIYWINDPEGCSGKSKLVKWFAVNYNDVCKISFGSATQIRSALITIGPKKCYFIDMPRTLGDEESESSILSAIEDLKNGFIVSVMYGKYQSLLFEPPHVVIFSNHMCPRNKMSKDRWKELTILESKEFFKDVPNPGNNFGIGQTNW